MARREVVEITCDRCSRTETQTSTEAPKGGSPEFVGTFHGEKVSYDDLCKRCREAVSGYYSRIAKKADDQVVVAPVVAPTPALPQSPNVTEVKEEPKRRSFLGGLSGK